MAEPIKVVPVGQEKDAALAEDEAGILKRAEEAEVLANAELVCNLRRMVNEPAFSDVVFLCNDGKRVQASRLLLAARSEVLKSMLMNGMAESRLSEIEVPEICSPVLLAVFEFLYTGTLCDYQPQGWEIACRLIIASRFLLLPKLEIITRKFMHHLTSAVVEDLPKAASMLTEAIALNRLFDNTDANLKELVKILSSNLSDSMYVRSLSEDAFDYLLKNSGGSCEDTPELLFEEYLRFRQVIRWWAYKSDVACATEEMLTFVAPDEEEALSVCRDPDSFARNESATESVADLAHYSHCWRADTASRRSAMRLMSNIDYRWIHPVLLEKVVEPLDVVSAATMLDCFRYHALRRPMVFETFDFCWEHGESYRQFEDGDKLGKAQDGVGLAVMTAPMSRSFGVHQWSFTLTEFCDEFVEMGFMYYGSKKPKLDGEKLSDQHDARVLKFHGDKVSVNTKGTGGRLHWRVLKSVRGLWKQLMVPVVFTYDAQQHACSLTIDGEHFGTLWKQLRSEVYYPAVSLGTTSRGSVSSELVSGFDFL